MTAGQSSYSIAKAHGWSYSSVKALVRRLALGGDGLARVPGRKHPNLAEKVRLATASLKAQPRQSLRKLARDLKVPFSTLRKYVIEGFNPLRTVCGPRLSESNVRARLTFCMRTLRQLSAGSRSRVFGKARALRLGRAVWLDEKWFKIKPPLVSQNTRVWLDSKKRKRAHAADPATAKHLRRGRSQSDGKGVMCTACVSGACGLLQPFFSPKGLKINGEEFCRQLDEQVIPAIAAAHGTRLRTTLIMDNCPSHCSKATRTHLAKKYAWLDITYHPPCSPDLSVLDFGVFATVLAKHPELYEQPSLECLITTIAGAFREMQHDALDYVHNGFPSRLRASLRIAE